MKPVLTAVMAADVAGYSRMMGEDAGRTLAALRRLRAELFAPAVAGHRGKLVKNMGDGWIVTFASAVDAVTCAMRLQDKMVPEPDISLRMGIHIGDVAQIDEDVFGDGVNVAARLETLCEPGGVAISDAVFGTLDGTLRPAFDDAGDHDLKNIARPVRVWTRGGIAGSDRYGGAGGKPGFPRVQIVPVASVGRGGIGELASALTHDLEAYLSQSRWLLTSVTLNPGPGTFVLTSRLRASGAGIRLESRLLAPGGALVWSGKHNGTLADAFAWQDETGAEIASRVMFAAMEHSQAHLSRKPQNAWTGEDWLLKGTLQVDGSRAGSMAGLDCAARAIRADPDLGYAYEVALALVAGASSLGYSDLVARYQPVVDGWVKKATELSTGSPSFRAILAMFRYVQTGDVAQARADAGKILRDLPFDPEALLFAGYVFNFISEPHSALECFDKFNDVARHHHFVASARNGARGACVMLGRYDDALVHLDAALHMAPGYIAAYRWRAAALANLGRLDEARATLAEHDRIQPGQTIALVRAGSNYVRSPETDRYFDGLRLAGMPE